MAEKGYFLGLDIGTDSVGWAVTDPEYHLIKRHGKALWGVRLFDPAQPAQERRTYRTARRRLDRQRARIEWLQQVFSQEIAKVDPAFFQRLRESRFLEEDKQADVPLGRYTLFADRNYNDSTYHKQYPTIYHLRKALIESAAPKDVRLVYLALHHLLKHRGHFLYGDVSLDTITLEFGLLRLSEVVDREYDHSLTWRDEKCLEEILLSPKLNKNQRKKLLAEQFDLKKADGPCYALIELIAGSKVSLDALFGAGTGSEELSKISLEEDFEPIRDPLTALLGDQIEVILAAKGIRDWALLETILRGERYLSFAKVREYEQHGQDLKELKQAVRALDRPELYREIFHTAKAKLDNYPAYSGKGAKNYRCSYDDFLKYLAGRLKSFDQPQIKEILQKLETGTYLAKQVSQNNGVIPYQLQEAELVKILDNASQYLPFLRETDESGLTRAEQIHQVFSFRVPFYVGPMDSRSGNSWIIRKNETIYPWNFEQTVDLEKCREEFIRRMTAKCSYIGEDVLPKNSLLYTSFMVLNELNNLRINGHPIQVSQKQKIYQDLFLTGKKITQKKLRAYLQLEKEDVISGIDGDFKATLAPWKYFDWLIDRTGGRKVAEEIILQITLFGKDKKLLRSWLHKTYGSLLTAEEEKRALAFQSEGWGRLSRIFLTEIHHTDPDTKKEFSIIDLLWQTNDNLMQLLSSRYTFAQAVAQYREKKLENQTLTLRKYLQESYASPAIQRAIHQVVGITDEIADILHTPPRRIFVEMAREDGEKGKRTVSRKAELMALYQNCGEECSALFEQLSETADGAFRRDKLYLYYTQMGRCMYSGERIDLQRLDTDYDIDHIYPQSKTKDDSIRNRVLVKRQLNSAKSDHYPIDAGIRNKMSPFWQQLLQKGFLSREKFDRLVRDTPFTLEEQAGFIARQLVETRQSSKIVAELLQHRFGDATEIVYVKAGIVSSFRQDQKLTPDGKPLQLKPGRDIQTTPDPLFAKCREINDLHHAKDAYLNIVTGNVYHVKFTRNPLNFLREKDARYNMRWIFSYNVERDGERAWTAGEDGSIATVRKTMAKNNILLTRRASEETGALFQQTIHPKTGENSSVSDLIKSPIKTSDPRLSIEKYGYYDNLTGAYFILVEHTVRKKRVRSLETVFLMYRHLYEQDPVRYCCETLGLSDPRVLIPKIRINALFSFSGSRMHISGRTGKQISFKNANPLILDPIWHSYVRALSKYLGRCRAARRDLEISRFDGLSAAQNEQLYLLLLEKLEKPLYRVAFKSVCVTLRERFSTFSALSVPDQGRVLMQILNLFANNAATADLKLLNASSRSGNILFSKNINNKKPDQIFLIHQSITGFYEQQIDLLAEVPG